MIRESESRTPAFSLRSKTPNNRSPFDIPGVNADVSAEDIVSAVRAGRER